MFFVTMKFLAFVVIAICASAQARFVAKTPAVTLLDYYKTSRDEGRIIGGQFAKQGQFPYQASILFNTPEGTSLCGGSLISPRWVLTAGHCVHVEGATLWTVKVGGIHFNVNVEEPGSVVTNSETGITNEGYNSYLNNDIALIKLDKDIPLSDTIQTIRLPRRSDANDTLANIKVTVSGYGKTSDSNTTTASPDLKFVELDTITNDECVQHFNSHTIISSTICAVGHPDQSTCHGDSGGPLTHMESDGQLTLVGVASFVSPYGCAVGQPSGYVRTAHFLDWINEKTGIAVRP